MQHLSLTRPFSPEDVLVTMKGLAKNKSSGPDEFTPEVFVVAWDIVGLDVTSAILHFFNTLSMPRMVNTVAIALVPKIEGASKMSQFRPISCCNTVYKCISKLLTARLKTIMPSIISLN